MATLKLGQVSGNVAPQLHLRDVLTESISTIAVQIEAV